MTTLLTRGRSIGSIVIGLVALIAYVVTASPGRSQDVYATVSVSSAVVQPNSQAIVDLVVTPEPAATVGALRVVVTYDVNLLSVAGCTNTLLSGLCNTNFGPNQVAFAYASPTGISGVVGSITFNALAVEGVGNLGVSVTTCADEQGTYGTCATQDGAVTIAAPTPTPTPSPSPTPTPSPTQTPTPAPAPSPKVWGDVNCDGDVNAVDALALLRKVAGLPVSQVAPCPTVGTLFPPPPPAVQISKRADGSDLDTICEDPETTTVGSTVTFCLVIDNDSDITVTVESLVDSVPGASCDAIGKELAPDDGDADVLFGAGPDAAVCTYEIAVAAAGTLVNTATVTVSNGGRKGSDSDTATVNIS